MLKSFRPLVFKPSGARLFQTSTILGMKNYYEILGVSKRATQQEIKSAYYEKAKSHHPDANTTASKADALKFEDISEAYETLSDQSKRRAYDSTIRLETADDFTQTRPRETFTRHKPVSREPINMSHIQYVYRTMNKEDEVQGPPKFRPFEDHNYPGTQFNKYEYSRRWDPHMNTWAYIKKKTADDYNRQLKEKQKLITMFSFFIMSGALIFVALTKSFFKDDTPKRRQNVSIDEEGRVVYVIDGSKF